MRYEQEVLQSLVGGKGPSAPAACTLSIQRSATETRDPTRSQQHAKKRLLRQHRVQARQQLFVVRDEPIVGAELVPLENTLDVEVIPLGLIER